VIFIDASALVAIITKEPGHIALAKALESESSVACSAISIWETVAALVNSYRFSVPAAQNATANYVRDLNFHYVPIGVHENVLAIAAYEKFGKGRHPAALNMGDCFAYACAKANNARLLFKGGDFGQTDIAAA